jgi:GNAT superfamily N-acetyltransferase
MPAKKFRVRCTEKKDVASLIEICKAVYPTSPAWAESQLLSHQNVFPEGQLVAESLQDGSVVGFAASLIVNWDDYDWVTPWRDFTDGGMFTNHDPVNGRTLYGAEIMVHPKFQGTGCGKALYVARQELVERLKLVRIRAGARLIGYHKHAQKMSAEDYVLKVVNHELTDKTLSFQLKRGFHVLKVIPNYLRHDPESLGFAAIIEWINLKEASERHYEQLIKSPYYKG